MSHARWGVRRLARAVSGKDYADIADKAMLCVLYDRRIAKIHAQRAADRRANQ